MASESLSHCIACKNPIPSPSKSGRKYCSHSCYHHGMRTGLSRAGREIIRNHSCARCGAPARRTPSTRRNGEKSSFVYCSRACYDSERADRRADCLECGVRLAVSGQKYCSMSCRIAHKKPGPCNCNNCGVLFTAMKVINRPSGKKLIAHSAAGTCSVECHHAWIRNNPERKAKISAAFTGQKHPAWQGGSHREGFRGHEWDRLSESIRDRAGRCCEHCGMSEAVHLERYRQRLNVNHKIPFHQHRRKSEANSASNLEALCKPCHTRADWKWRKENPVQSSLSFR